MTNQYTAKRNFFSLILKCSVCTVLACTLLFSLVACCLTYDFVDDGEFGIGYSKLEKRAYIAHCLWDGDRDDITFVIPDDYNGLKICDLGGYFGRGVPCPFRIYCDIGEITPVGSSVEDDDDYENLVFTVVLGKNITNLVYIDGKSYWGTFTPTEDGGRLYDTLYKVVYRFDVDPENPAFYSLDGKLYKKSNDGLVDEFFYE